MLHFFWTETLFLLTLSHSRYRLHWIKHISYIALLDRAHSYFYTQKGTVYCSRFQLNLNLSLALSPHVAGLCLVHGCLMPFNKQEISQNKITQEMMRWLLHFFSKGKLVEPLQYTHSQPCYCTKISFERKILSVKCSLELIQ